ncbi:MAG: ATP phosphoribosyltransferase regulatory subunit, partial [Pseudomonadota bacterium]
MVGADAGWVNAGTARHGAALADVDAVVEAITRLYASAGYRPLVPPHLFQAEVMLDLYGEDLRSRAFLFPGGGGEDGMEELCLRPDFTVPVAIAHGEAGWARAAKYAYRGPVFRRQERGAGRPIEYLQAGIENIGALDPAAAEAQVLSLTLQGLETVEAEGYRVTTGDLGIVFALLDAIIMPKWLRRRLRRHVWRPKRFADLIEEAVALEQPPQSPRRSAILAAARDGLPAIDSAARAEGEVLGMRGLSEMAERAIDLSGPAAAPPHLAPEQGALIEAVLSLAGESGEVLGRLRDLTAAAGVDLSRAIEAFERRLDAFNRAGLDGEALAFDARFGRALEYYDGFVFEVTVPDRPWLPPLAGGGRYDSLTIELGAAGHGVPAVGAMLRPEAAMAARAPHEPAAPPAPAPTLAGAPSLRRIALSAGDLVLALPSKGRLQQDTIDWFAARGIAIRRTGAGREYSAAVEGVPGLGVALLSAGEIPGALEAGQVHLGVTGEDLIQERVANWDRRVALLSRMGFGHA